ncbi:MULTISPECIES: hypothetical protein [Sphingobacterium]|uniref:Uncharacterized protein n=1 Tax=Sphingobacterium populi TaxID=1812824 RepID=A0ABW5UB91_9SPHI|nr:hypothetical protein [Sphingobacterium sp. CFCC 11742]
MKNTFAVKTSLFTLILALIAIGTFAFTAVMNKQSVGTNKLQNTFHFVGDSEDPGQFSEIENWREGTSNACGTVGQKPCEITVEANNLDELATYLSGMDNEAVLDINPSSKRP